MPAYRNPTPTVDIVIACPGGGVVLIERRNEPHGWALPGGFVDYGETLENAAIREAKEETGLDVELTGLLGVYSDPERDPRQHTMSVVYTARAHDIAALGAGDDAARAQIFPLERLPAPLCFDHGCILEDYARGFAWLNTRKGRWK
ncbi:NUDIX hydrolase [Fundidesulfovibrio agrisoli]|uniref:NUDIX hydrolase n=1 Tax=Fundidesulfovibrio agrisoli TaxID=2922717 RepID=UPI00311A94BF